MTPSLIVLKLGIIIMIMMLMVGDDDQRTVHTDGTQLIMMVK